MAYHAASSGSSGHHHLGFGTGLPPIHYGHAASGPSNGPSASMLGNTISSHSFPIAPSTHTLQQQQARPAPPPQQQQQQQQSSLMHTGAPGVTDGDGLIAPPSMPLELDFDNLQSASNYMHTYALSQGFDIRIQWSANNQTRICWSCFRGGYPESQHPDGTPTNGSSSKKRQIPKEKERRKRGSLKIGCPFRVQCTKNWKSDKMELRILEGRHNHPMESDRENLPSQVRRIKGHRKSVAADSSSNNNAAVAPTSRLPSTPTVAPSQQQQQQQHMLTTAPTVSAHHHLMTPASPEHDMIDFGSPDPIDKPSFERNLFTLLGVYDKSDPISRAAIERDLGAVMTRAKDRLDSRKRQRTELVVPAPPAPVVIPTTPTPKQQQKAQQSSVLDPSPGTVAPPTSGKGSARCSNCKEYGHNRRRCPLG